MSYNGSGTFVINSAGTPYVSGTVISSNAANALNNDLATGLTTAITKDGQTTPTANIPLGGFKITNLGAGTVASDAARLSQVQNSTTTTLISITGTDTLTGTVSPTLTAYATGQVFSFVVAATNTGAVTLNVDSIGVKAVTRTGAVALVAGDMVTGQVAVVEYDGTRFQLINGNSFTNLKASGTLGVTGATTLSSTLNVTGVATLGNGAILNTPASGTVTNLTGTASININGTVGATTPATGSFTTLSTTGNVSVANGSVYGWGSFSAYMGGSSSTNVINFLTSSVERMRIDSSGNVGIGTSSPANKLEVSGSLLQGSAWAVIGDYNSGGTFPTPTNNAVAFAWNFTGGGRDVTMMNNDYSGQGVRFVQRTAAATSSYVGRGAQTGDWFQGNNSASWSTVSDIRIKQNVRPLNDSLAKITALNPCHFEYKNTPEKIKTGFIAQEFEQILPGHVQESEPDVLFSEYFDLEAGEKMKSIDPDLIPYLVGAIKDLKAIIDTQAARITALETA